LHKTNKKYLAWEPPPNKARKAARDGARGFTLRSYGEGCVDDACPPSYYWGTGAPILLITVKMHQNLQNKMTY